MFIIAHDKHNFWDTHKVCNAKLRRVSEKERIRGKKRLMIKILYSIHEIKQASSY